MSWSPRVLALTVPFLCLAAPAVAGPKGNLTGAAAVDPVEVPVGVAARFNAVMCNTGPTFVGGTAFLGMFVPTGVGYTVAHRPKEGVCKAVLYDTYTYVYCTVALKPGKCDVASLNVTPTAAGDWTLYVLADSLNALKESNEADNDASAVLTAY